MNIRRIIRYWLGIGRLEKIMADIKQQIADLTAEVSDTKTKFDAFKDAVTAKAADLQAQIDALTGQANPDLSGLQAAVDGLRDDVNAAG